MKKGYTIKPYAHDRLKWVVRGKERGKYVRKFFETRGEAETYAQQKNIELVNLGLEGAAFPIELRVMAQEAARELEPFGKTIRDAKDFFIQHLLRTKKSVPLVGVIDEVIATKIAMGVKPRTMKTYRGYVKKFAADFPARDIGAITTEEVENWLIRNFSNPVSRNNYRRVLVNLFNIAKKKKYVDKNPVAEIGTASEPSGEVGILRPEQVASLLNHPDSEILPYFVIAAFAGIRPEELRKPAELAAPNSELLWSDIKWKQGIIRVRAEVSKVGKARNVTMEPNLREWLEPYVHMRGKVCTPSWLRLFRKTRREAGVTDWPSDCLRHSFATYWLQKYKDAPRLALEMGNSVSVILEHYHQVLDEPKDAERYWAIKPGDQGEKVIPITA
jgi:integrase